MRSVRLAFSLTLLMILAALQPMAAHATDLREHTELRITYTENGDDTLTVTDYDSSGAPGPICILTEYQFEGDDAAQPVVAIADDVFSDASPTVSGVSALVGESCFDGLPEHLATIGNGAFRNGNFTTLTLPDSVTDIGDEAFAQGHLESLTLGPNIDAVGDRAFKNNPLLEVIGLDSLDTLGEEAFADNLLTELNLSPNLEIIPTGAFANSNDLAEVIIPASVVEIGDRAFYNNGSLASVKFLGAAPVVTEASDADRSFNNDPGPTMEYLRQFDATERDGGFTNPWLGYNASTNKVKPSLLKVIRPGKRLEKKNFTVKVRVKDGDHLIQGGVVRVYFKGRPNPQFVDVTDGVAVATFKAPPVRKTRRFDIVVTYRPGDAPYKKRSTTTSIKIINR